MEVAGIGDKRRITITVAGTMSGQILPFQVLYEGKTEVPSFQLYFSRGV